MSILDETGASASTTGVHFRTGPFRLHGQPFVVVAASPAVVDLVTSCLVDLRSDEVEGCVEYVVERGGPSWLRRAWSVDRDGRPLSGEFRIEDLAGLIVRNAAWKAVTARTDELAIESSVLANGSRGVLFTMSSEPLDHSLWPWWRHAVLVDALGRARWTATATGGISLLAESSTGWTIEPSWVPLDLPDGSADRLGRPRAGDQGGLVPASQLATIGGAVTLGAVVMVTPTTGPESSTQAASAARCLAQLTPLLRGRVGTRRRRFRRAAGLVDAVPAFDWRVGVEDLSSAVAALDDVVKAAT